MLNDPRFPDRPQHPDFWSLVDVANQLDGRASEGGESLPQILELVGVDLDSALYMATQKAAQASQLFGIPGSVQPHLTSMFLNGLAVGALYERKKHGG